MLKKLRQKTSFLVRFAENIKPVISSCASVAGVGCMGNVVVLGKLKEDSNFKYQACANQPTDISEDCPSVELSSVSL